MKPYIVFTDAYTEQSAGVAVTHNLVHLLNEAGAPAWVFANGVNPLWNTPRPENLQEAQALVRQGIVIYPEVVKGNPLKAVRVVHYVLNIPGVLMGDTEDKYLPGEPVFAYSPVLAERLNRCDGVMQIQTIDQSIFNADGRTDENLKLLYRGKWQGPGDWGVEFGAIEITRWPRWPRSKHELAALLRRGKMLYTYDALTALADEARLCGCAVCVVHPDRYTKKEIAANISAAGLAWGLANSEFDKALETIGQFPADYAEKLPDTPAMLKRFVEITQEAYK